MSVDDTQTSSDVDVISSVLDNLKGSKYYEAIQSCLNSIAPPDIEVQESEQAARFLQWCRKHNNIKLVSADVPARILPNDYKGILHDVKVFVKNGPDDLVYDNDTEVRSRVARGNCFLELTNKAPRTFCVLQAMKKFTGGLGDDDDRDSGDDSVWQRYFTKPLDEAKLVTSTEKINGEAAHLSCIRIDGHLVLCGGSKNVHLLFKNKRDIDCYVEPRYCIAKEVCHTIMDCLDRMTNVDQIRLMSFLAASKYTAVFEILVPSHQHVVNLSHLKKPALKFISWTKCELEPSEKLEHLNIISPVAGLEIARELKLDPVGFEEIPMKDLDHHMKQIRKEFNTEGQVLYFLDKSCQVIGVLKKKTAWYIMCRAIREKLKAAVSQSIKNAPKFSKSRHHNQVVKRIGEIQMWLKLDSETTSAWQKLGTVCLNWVLQEVDDGRLSLEEVQDLFPVYWERFLSETGSTDRVDVHESQFFGACTS